MKTTENRDVCISLYQVVAITAVGLATSSQCLVAAYGMSSTTPSNSLWSNPLTSRSSVPSRSRRSTMYMYTQGDAPSCATPDMVRGTMTSSTRDSVSYSPFVDLVDGGGTHSAQAIREKSTPLSPMAKNTMIGGDSHPMSHGLLSPFTVSFIADVCPEESIESKTLQSFLHTYRSAGPMACVHFLSDPHVLPILTKAMREAYHHASINWNVQAVSNTLRLRFFLWWLRRDQYYRLILGTSIFSRYLYWYSHPSVLIRWW